MKISKKAFIISFTTTAVFIILLIHPFAGVTQDGDNMVLGRVYNDTDIAPPLSGPVPLNIVVDEIFMGRVEPGESLVVSLEKRRVPYEFRAYVFMYDGSSFFAEVDLPLSHPVAVPISHRGELSPFWVAFEGI